ncbi:MAG: uroporphyrinogen-III synthase [Candidatus Thermoplasmatota archaeon]|nr:uroporphyrinogen-III synthase [Candidatus Thermoplasmatota archaeon]
MVHRVAYVGAPLEFEIGGVIQIPVLRISYQDLSTVGSIDGTVVFTSKRGIISLKKSNVSLKCDRIYCIGTQTSHYLKDLYSMDCTVPTLQTTEGLAEMLIGSETSINLVASDLVDDAFLARLKSNGIGVRHIVSYRIEENREADYRPLHEADRILVGSSKSFEILHENEGKLLNGKELYAVGRPTEETMNRLGYGVTERFDTPNIRVILNKLSTKR